MARPERILFFAEAVSLAHMVRALALARCLPEADYEVHFACADSSRRWLPPSGFGFWPIETVSPDHFRAALAKGHAIYDAVTIARYVQSDLAVIDAVAPDLVVGDFRLSLSVSAPLRGVPFVNVVNAHWSPHARRAFPLPDHPLVRYIGLAPTAILFRLVRPFAFRRHAAAVNRTRRRFGLPSLGSLTQVYAAGDAVLFPDPPSLVSFTRPPPGGHVLGPVLWEPETPRPQWWEELLPTVPTVYVTLGSSGPAAILPTVLRALSHLPVQVMVATAGRGGSLAIPGNARVAEFLPGIEAARRSRLVICNGGSATAYQALAAGVPVLGIASNMDQFLTMQAIAGAGAGRLLRASQADEASIFHGARRMLDDDHLLAAARRIAEDCATVDAPTRFRALVKNPLLRAPTRT